MDEAKLKKMDEFKQWIDDYDLLTRIEMLLKYEFFRRIVEEDYNGPDMPPCAYKILAQINCQRPEYQEIHYLITCGKDYIDLFKKQFGCVPSWQAIESLFKYSHQEIYANDLDKYRTRVKLYLNHCVKNKVLISICPILFQNAYFSRDR